MLGSWIENLHSKISSFKVLVEISLPLTNVHSSKVDQKKFKRVRKKYNRVFKSFALKCDKKLDNTKNTFRK